ncbi:hypothetical protein KIW84_030875 [Lathyrus oleraceus]|uniref:Helitron helicase-like domain-containing protein n=1 Tax=Pisum sativum TaxID=3888 RepID=A0A9D5AZK1_PEA|nr:hypothetical protein KIW84_030875 [Pisum sativum]
MCCKGGNVTISQVSAPDELLQLFLDSSTEGRHFRQHIRSYNHVMSFTSLGVHVDESLVATGRGIYTFRAQGAIYHKIGGFHPNQGSRPRYLQLYIYDTDHELQNRMRENPILNQTIVYKLQKLLHHCNLFVIVFRQLALEPNIEECGGDEDTIERGRDINVINCDGKLTKLKDDVINKGVLGRVKSYMYVTEFQKHGLPHVHMLLILDTDDKLREPEEYDSMVKAEIPRHESEPELYEVLLKHIESKLSVYEEWTL